MIKNFTHLQNMRHPGSRPVAPAGAASPGSVNTPTARTGSPRNA